MPPVDPWEWENGPQNSLNLDTSTYKEYWRPGYGDSGHKKTVEDGDEPGNLLDKPGDEGKQKLLPCLGMVIHFELAVAGTGWNSGWFYMAFGSGEFKQDSAAHETWYFENEYWRRLVYVSYTWYETYLGIWVPTNPRFQVYECEYDETDLGNGVKGRSYKKIDWFALPGDDPYRQKMSYEGDALWGNQFLENVPTRIYVKTAYARRNNRGKFWIKLSDPETRIKIWSAPGGGARGIGLGSTTIRIRTIGASAPPPAGITTQWYNTISGVYYVFYTVGPAVWWSRSVDGENWTEEEFYKPDEFDRSHPWLLAASSGQTRLVYWKTGTGIVQLDITDLENKQFGEETTLVADGTGLVGIADPKVGYWIFYWKKRTVGANQVGSIYARFNPTGDAGDWTDERVVLPEPLVGPTGLITDLGEDIPEQTCAVTISSVGRFTFHWIDAQQTIQHTTVSAHAAQFGSN